MLACAPPTYTKYFPNPHPQIRGFLSTPFRLLLAMTNTHPEWLQRLSEEQKTLATKMKALYAYFQAGTPGASKEHVALMHRQFAEQCALNVTISERLILENVEPFPYF